MRGIFTGAAYSSHMSISWYVPYSSHPVIWVSSHITYHSSFHWSYILHIPLTNMYHIAWYTSLIWIWYLELSLELQIWSYKRNRPKILEVTYDTPISLPKIQQVSKQQDSLPWLTCASTVGEENWNRTETLSSAGTWAGQKLERELRWEHKRSRRRELTELRNEGHCRALSIAWLLWGRREKTHAYVQFMRCSSKCRRTTNVPAESGCGLSVHTRFSVFQKTLSLPSHTLQKQQQLGYPFPLQQTKHTHSLDTKSTPLLISNRSA